MGMNSLGRLLPLAFLFGIFVVAAGLSIGRAQAGAPANNELSRVNMSVPLDTPSPTPVCDPDYTVTTATGTIVPGTTDIGNHCDNCTTYVLLPFRYYLYNSWNFNARISSNGNFQLVYANTTSANTCLPAANFDQTIFGYWDDLRTDCTGCGVFTSITGTAPNRTYNIEWRAAQVSGGGNVNFEIRLYEGQRKFDIVYGNVDDAGAAGTVGVEGGFSIGRATQFSCNEPVLSSGLQLTFELPACATSPTSTPFPTSTYTETPEPTNTTGPTSTPIIPDPCGPHSNYAVAAQSGSIDPGLYDINNHCDDCQTLVQLPFIYRLYGQLVSSANVGSNGTLQFSSNYYQYRNACLPASVFYNTIFPFWDDLRTDAAGSGIFTSVTGTAPNRAFNIEWRATTFSNNVAVNFEVRLYEGQDRFDVVYGAMADDGSSATVGVQAGTGSTGALYTVYECSTGGLTSGLLLAFSQPSCGSPTPTVTGTPPTATPTATPIPTNTGTSTRTPTATRTGTRTPSATNTPNLNTGYAHFAPSSPITVSVGTSFTLDLLVNSGTNNVAAQQSYLTFTNTLLKVVDPNAPGCALTETVAPDTSTFDSVLQNEVCNSDTPCDFGRIIAPPASIGFASGTLLNPPATGDFRVARVAFCATATGTARLHWEFSPPAPANRDSEVLDENGNVISNPGLYADYTINVVANPSNVLVGHVTWQGRPAQPDPRQQVPITLTLKSGSTQVDYLSQATDPNGYFTVSIGTLPAGTYNWRVKDPKYLANSGAVTLSGASSTGVEMGLMKAGDATNDNLVSSGDFIILRSAFGRASGSPGYDDRADFTGDLVVNTTDFNMLKANFGLGGAPPLQNPGR